jgi:hypothetical protein
MKLTHDLLLDLGFKPMPHFTIMGTMIFVLGRNRHLSIGNVGTPNEMMFVCQQEGNTIIDLVCLHNYDYDGYLRPEKLVALMTALTL